MGCCHSNTDLKTLSTFIARGHNPAKVDPATVPIRTFAGQTRFALVTDIYDGDTITVICRLDQTEQFKKYKVRLYGLDTPEIKPSLSLIQRDLHIAAAVKVRNDLSDLILGKIVKIEFLPEEKFGRNLGTVFTLNDRCVNTWLIETGRACQYSGGTKKTFTIGQLESILRL